MYINQWESEHQTFDPCSIVTPLEDITTIINGFQTQQHYQNQIDIPIWSNDFFMTKQDQLTNPFQLVVDSLMSSSEHSITSSEKCSEIPSCSDNKPNCEHFPQQQNKVLEGDLVPDQRSREISFQRNKWESCTKQDKQYGIDFATSSNSDLKVTAKGKRRLSWTKELHEPFITIVNQLGGPEKAKPKAIQQMMGLDVLTISHVKSHLQKYRSTLHTHKALKGISMEEQRTQGINELQVQIQMQIEESRQLQLEIERSNQRQLEVQKNLQLVIEQQRKQLKLILNQQKQRTKLEKIPELKQK